MAGKTHKFKEKLAEGEVGEQLLDAFLRKEGFWVTPATHEEQLKKKIDRHLRHKITGDCFTVDYKLDKQADRTGNAFIETVSIDTAGIAGWAVQSEADRIYYFLEQSRLLYMIKTEAIHENLSIWSHLFPTRSATNEGYKTHGILVPLIELAFISLQVVKIPEEVL